MFEYTALVDAPVQRFTGIVTGADPEDERVVMTVRTPAPFDALPGTEAPLMIVAEAPASMELAAAREPADAAQSVGPAQLMQPAEPLEPMQLAEPIVTAPPIALAVPIAIDPPGSVPVEQPSRVAMHRPAPGAPPAVGRPVVVRRAAPAPSQRPAIVPALAAIAAAGITAMWWLRKDHDRPR